MNFNQAIIDVQQMLKHPNLSKAQEALLMEELFDLKAAKVAKHGTIPAPVVDVKPVEHNTGLSIAGSATMKPAFYADAHGYANQYGSTPVWNAPIAVAGVGVKAPTYSTWMPTVKSVVTKHEYMAEPKGLPYDAVTSPSNAEVKALVAAANKLLEADGFNTKFDTVTKVVKAEVLAQHQYDFKGSYTTPEKVAKGKGSMIDFFDLVSYEDEINHIQHTPYLDAIDLLEFYATNEGSQTLETNKAVKAKLTQAKANTVSNAAVSAAGKAAKYAKQLAKLVKAGKPVPKHLEQYLPTNPEQEALEAAKYAAEVLKDNELKNKLNGLDVSTYPVASEFEHDYSGLSGFNLYDASLVGTSDGEKTLSFVVLPKPVFKYTPKHDLTVA